MARQIVEQPNGKYALWSTIIDDFLITNATEKEIVAAVAKEAFEDKKDTYSQIFDYIKTDNEKKQHYVKDYKECMAIKQDKK